MKPRLQVMKFRRDVGGRCGMYRQDSADYRKAAKENPCIAVVSAMGGVTNRLIEAARKAQGGGHR